MPYVPSYIRISCLLIGVSFFSKGEMCVMVAAAKPGLENVVCRFLFARCEFIFTYQC